MVDYVFKDMFEVMKYSLCITWYITDSFNILALLTRYCRGKELNSLSRAYMEIQKHNTSYVTCVCLGQLQHKQSGHNS